MENEEKAEGTVGKIQITADEQASASNEEMNYQLQGSFSSGSGMVFFLVYKFISPQVYKPIYKSEIKSSRNGVFSWEKTSSLVQDLCSDDPEREIRIEFFKSEKSGLNKNKGYITFNLAQLKEGQRLFSLHNSDGKTTKYQITFSQVAFSQRYSFLEYIFGGCEI